MLAAALAGCFLAQSSRCLLSLKRSLHLSVKRARFARFGYLSRFGGVKLAASKLLAALPLTFRLRPEPSQPGPGGSISSKHGILRHPRSAERC
jgi:hypothetical protein